VARRRPLRGHRGDAVMAEINITPFTDVLLVLLIIFMLLATLTTPPGFEKRLPRRGPTKITSQDLHEKTIEVQVAANGSVRIDRRASSLVHLYRDLARAAGARHGHIHVAILADMRSPYGVIIRILDAAKIARLDDVGFVATE